MNQAWPTKRLADVCQILGGATPSKKNPKFYGGDIPWATVGDMNVEIITTTEEYITKAAVADCSTNVIPSGSIVMATRVGLGKVCVLGQDTAINQDLKGLTPKNPKELTNRWLYWWLKSKASDIQKAGTGATVQGVKMTFVQELEIPLPPLAEQKRIVALLDEAFAGIDEAKANTEACQESAKSIFSNYLEAAFQQNGPGWAEVAISELCDVKHGYAFDGADFSSDVPEGNPLIVTPGNFTEDGKLCFNSKNSKRLRPNPPAEFKFNIGDLVVVMTDLSSQMKILGKPAFVETDNLLHNQRIGKLVFSSERVDQRLVYFFMMTQRYLKNIKVTSTGTMVKHTAPKRITSNLISFPENRARQLEVIAKLDELRKETQCLAKTHEDKKRALIELKSSLLAQAFAGELTA
jgi:type I restriction enzyme S subunit